MALSFLLSYPILEIWMVSGSTFERKSQKKLLEENFAEMLQFL